MTRISTPKLAAARSSPRASPAPPRSPCLPIVRAGERSIKIGVYGGYFKKSFDKNIFPDFTKATGIAIESVGEPTGEAWLVQFSRPPTPVRRQPTST